MAAKKKVAKKSPACLVVLVVDASGSMQPYTQDVIGGVNGFVQNFSAGAPKASLAFVKFSTTVDAARTFDPAGTMPPLTGASYAPDGMTALLDAVAAGVAEGDSWLAAHKGGRVVVTIYTDGHENQSIKHKRADVLALVQARTASGWEFIYLGAVADAWDQGQALGVAAGSTMTYDLGQTKAAMGAAGTLTAAAMMRGASVSASYSASPAMMAAGVKKAKARK